MPWAAREIIASAVQRGAITEARARYWQTVADAGQDVSVLDRLAVPAQARPPGPVAAAAPPPGADPAMYAANPLLDQMRRDRPALVAAALAEDPNPPRLFGNADLPPFTASGLDPAVLAGLPWPLRRPAAGMAKLADVYALTEDADAAGLAVADAANSPANQGYVSLSTSGPGHAGDGDASTRPGSATTGGAAMR